MKFYISKNIKAARRALLLFGFMAAIFILGFQGAYAMSFTAFPHKPDTDTKIELGWSSVAGAEMYQLTRNDGHGSITTLSGILVNDVYDSLAYVDTGLVPDNEYTYTVRAYSDTGSAIQLDEKTAVAKTSKIIDPYEVKAVYDINAKEVLLTWKSSAAATGSTLTDSSGHTSSSGATTNAAIKLAGMDIRWYSILSNSPYGASNPVAVGVTPIDAPTVTASISNGVAIVSWSAFPQITQFQLERSKWNGTSWEAWSIVNSSLSGASATDTPPTGGQYRYRIGAKTESSYSGYSNISETTRGLPAPTNLALTYDVGTITISWTNGEGSTARTQVLKKLADNSYSQVAICDSGVTFCKDTVNMTPGAIYTYRVRAYNSDSDYSAAAEASISLTYPAAPSSLTASVVSTSAVTLSWTDNSTNETGFKIERMTDTGGVFVPIATLPANTTTYTDNAVSTGTTYIYRIRSYNALGDSAYTSEVTVSAWDSIAPVSLTVTPVSASRLDLSWGYTGTGNYNTIIERKTGTDGTWAVINTTALGVLKYSDTGLAANTRYFYRVRKSMGTGSSGLPYPNNDIGIGAYTNLGNLTLTGSAAANNTIYLSWSGNSGTADVIIERKMPNGSFSALTTVSYTTVGWYDNTGLVPSASYTYRIKARTTTNESVYSNTITVQNLYLDAPSQLSVTITTNSAVQLKWKDNSTDETGFEIWRYIYGAGTYTLYATVDQNITTYTDNTIQKGVQYSYMVRAYVATGALYSPYSNTASIGSGLINPPSGLNYSYVSSTQVLLRWTDTSDNENGFKVEWKIGGDGEWNILSWLDPNVTAYNVTNLNPYTKYYFRIRAYSNSGNSDSLSEEILVSTAIPAAPSNVVATALSASQIRITWKDNSDSEDVFRIMRKPSNGYYYDVLAEVGKNNTSYTDSNLTAGMRYSYKVVSYNSTGSSESSAVEAKTNTKQTFSDLKSVSWAKDAIENLAGMGIMKGVTATSYMPNNTVTKAEFTAMVVRAFGLETAPVGSLADVKSNKWYYKEVMIAENLGIISADSTNRFYPEKAITREEIAVLLFKVMEAKGQQLKIHDNSALEKFTDKNKINPAAMSSMATIVGEGIMEGVSVYSVGPQLTATRAQAAVLLYRTMNKMNAAVAQ